MHYSKIQSIYRQGVLWGKILLFGFTSSCFAYFSESTLVFTGDEFIAIKDIKKGTLIKTIHGDNAKMEEFLVIKKSDLATYRLRLYFHWYLKGVR